MIQAEGIFAGGATKPYIEETYDSDRNLIDVKLHGYTKIRDDAFSGCNNQCSLGRGSGRRRTVGRSECHHPLQLHGRLICRRYMRASTQRR